MTKRGSKERTVKPLSEMREEAKTGEAGLRCPRCGCRHFLVTHTRHGPGRISRRRVCRYCGRVLVTEEKAVKRASKPG